MFVVASAGHVDHGKSTLVRALTGMEPDRWAEERRRGMTIDLGFAWTSLPSGQTVAFVDVPGHERFVPNMLAGVGPVPAVMFVVAADGGWMPQSDEHLAALDALGVRHGVLVVARSDLADPAGAMQTALEQIRRTSLGDVEAVAVSAVRGTGMNVLRGALDRMLEGVPAPDLAAPTRLWVDRSFTIRGSGTIVTGTLGAGAIRVGDRLEIGSTGRAVGVRGLQSLGAPIKAIEAVARIAVNLRGVAAEDLHRGETLLTAGAFRLRDVVDVRVEGDPTASLPPTVTLHIGSAAVPVHVRPLGTGTARLTLSRPLPLRVGDRGLARDPGRHRIVGGVVILDVAPPALRRRGSAAARSERIDALYGQPDEADELQRRGIVRRDELESMGVPVTAQPIAGPWLIADETLASLRARLPAVVTEWVADHPLESGPPVDVVRRALELPDIALVAAVVRPPLIVRAGRVVQLRSGSDLPPAVVAAVAELRTELTGRPFSAPDAARLAEVGLGGREIGAAVRAGALLRLAEGVVLLPGSADEALRVLATIPQPFTVSEAKQALQSTRRVAVPLLELLDRRGATHRLPDDRRELRPGVAPSPLVN